jgi:hypothetical protein
VTTRRDLNALAFGLSPASIRELTRTDLSRDETNARAGVRKSAASKSTRGRHTAKRGAA